MDKEDIDLVAKACGYELQDYQREALRLLERGEALVIHKGVAIGKSTDAVQRIKQALREAKEGVAIDIEAEDVAGLLFAGQEHLARVLTMSTVEFSREASGYLAPPKNKPWYQKFDKKRKPK